MRESNWPQLREMVVRTAREHPTWPLPMVMARVATEVVERNGLITPELAMQFVEGAILEMIEEFHAGGSR